MLKYCFKFRPTLTSSVVITIGYCNLPSHLTAILDFIFVLSREGCKMEEGWHLDAFDDGSLSKCERFK